MIATLDAPRTDTDEGGHAMTTMFETTSYDGEHAAILVTNTRRTAYIRPSTPLRAGQRVYAVETTYAQRGRYPETPHITLFRQREHAEAWFRLIAKIDPATKEHPS